MEALNAILPIVIYFLLIILIVVCIILVIKAIITINKVNEVADNVEKKLNILNGLFDAIDLVSEKVNSVYTFVFDIITNTLSKLLTNKKEKEDNDEKED